MKKLKGTSVAPGISRGTVCLYLGERERTLPHYLISSGQIPKELERLQRALKAAGKRMEEMVQAARRQLDKEASEIFNAHLSIITDRELFRKISQLIRRRRVNAEHAVNDAFEDYIKKYENKELHFRELIHDFADVRNHILGAFNGETGKFKCPIGEREPVIVAAERLTPSMVSNISRENVLAFVTKQGGFTSHATILARSYGVPVIFGIDVENNLDCGMKAIVDGSLGEVIVSPDRKTGEYYSRKVGKREKRKSFCDLKKELSARTGSGRRIKLKLNVNTPEELEYAKELSYDGIGLLRTEFLFRGEEVPSEEEQYLLYRAILQGEAGRPVAVRLLDIGRDKLPSYFKLPDQNGLDLGLRGAMAVETFPEIYLTQAKALLRANLGSNLQLLYPMVSDLEDLKTFRGILLKAKKALRKEHVRFNSGDIKEGLMIETPSAVMMAEELLKEVDFVNIGSNDLLQYTIAASRDNLLAENRYHILHPALVKQLEIIARAGKRVKKEVCLCGEIASFEEFYPLLLGIGLRSFSVAVPKLSDIKCELLHLGLSLGKGQVKDFYKVKSKEEIDKYFRA